MHGDATLFGCRFCHCSLGLLSAGAVECGGSLAGVWPLLPEAVIAALCALSKVGRDP